MESLLYAEIYLICIIVLGLLWYWTAREGSQSASERWLTFVLVGFLVNFLSNFCFTLVNGIFGITAGNYFLSYLLKTCYHLSLVLAVFFWCGYAEVESGTTGLQARKNRPLVAVLIAFPILLILTNLNTHWVFYISDTGRYTRVGLFHLEMLYLIAVSGVCGVTLLRHARRESVPGKRAHLLLTATFPLCLVLAWLMCFIGESVPVICVCIMLELLCCYMGTMKQQISMDKLTQVNNRQNLIGFMEYKLNNHNGDLFLLLMDVDDFKMINDTYGHLEGDAALVRVASSLKQACVPFAKRPYIARYGGDEFIIVLEGGQEDVDRLKQNIEERVRSTSREARGYDLGISVGVAQWHEGMNYKELIAEADERLYEIKRERKRRTGRAR